MKTELLKEKLREESNLVKEESMHVLNEFESAEPVEKVKENILIVLDLD